MLLADVMTADSDSLADVMTADSDSLADIMTADSDSLADGDSVSLVTRDRVSLVSRDRCLEDHDHDVRPLVTMASSHDGASGLVMDMSWLLGVGGGLYSQPWQGVKVRPSLGIMSLVLFICSRYFFCFP